jgi:7-cyano-7-deazaguanine tRNA-ribosyltransferase
MIANLGKWKGRKPSCNEWQKLRECCCPACIGFGVQGLKRNGIEGLCNRACHNLWVLLEEATWIKEQLVAKRYSDLYKDRLDNSTYLPLIESLVNINEGSK